MHENLAKYLEAVQFLTLWTVQWIEKIRRDFFILAIFSLFLQFV